MSNKNQKPRGKRQKVVLSMRIDVEVMEALQTVADTEYRTLAGLVHLILYEWIDSRNTVVALPRRDAK